MYNIIIYIYVQAPGVPHRILLRNAITTTSLPLVVSLYYIPYLYILFLVHTHTHTTTAN